jgi:hypothetical protein
VNSFPTKNSDYKGVSLKKDLVLQIEKYVDENPEYKSVADFLHEAARLRIEELNKSKLTPRFDHFNINENGVRITDRKIGLIAEIYFKPQGMFCDVDKSNECEHIDFALTVPAIKEVVAKKKKEGWNLPDV